MCGLTEQQWNDDPHAYVAVQAVCHWCAAKDRARSDGDTDRSLPGATIRLVPREVAETMQQLTPIRPRSARERAKQK